VTGAAGFAVGVLVTGVAALGRFAAAGGTVPIGLICASAGLSATEPITPNHKRELASRSIGPFNLFISNDNPASQKLHTSLQSGSPAPPPAIAPISSKDGRKPILKRRWLK
jgi:hypothetical protein